MKRDKIFIIISLIFFILYLFIIYSTYTKNKIYLLESVKNNQIKLVHAYKEKFDERLSALKLIVEMVGKSIIKKDRKKDFKLIKETLTNAMLWGNGFKSVYISYPDNFTISGRKDWYYTKDYIATKRPWYKDAIKNKKTSISKPYYGSPGFEDKIYISIVSPIYEKEKLLAVMSSDLELKLVQKEVSKLFSLEKGFAFLMTNDAKVITPSNKLGINFDNPNLKKFLSSFSNIKKGNKRFLIKDIPYIFTFETLENSDWFFVSVLKENEIFQDLNHQLFMNLLASFILFILGLTAIVVVSITQKKLYEKHLLLSHFAKSPTWGVLLTDKEGNVIFINKVFEKIFSLKSKSLYGKALDNIFEKLKYEQEKSQEILSFYDIKNNPFSVISYSLDKKSKVYRIQITPLLEYQKKFEGIIITVNDISHERYLEKKEVENEQLLIQNSKMAALGEMVSAIAHQWRQPLSTLLMLISNTEEIIDKEKFPKAVNYLNRAQSNIKLMNETIIAFRNFYKEDFGKEQFDLIELIEEVILITSAQIKINTIELNFISKLRDKTLCYSYPSYLKQVLINLIGNAKDELAIILKDDFSFQAYINITLTKKEGMFFIYVEDNAKGISSSNENKIFEPFFTTKGDKGTGTGLYLCKLLIENKMKGKITLESPCNPTRFLIKMKENNV